MHSIRLRAHVGSDGILQLRVPIGLQDTDIEVMVIVHPLEPEKAASPEERGWLPGFFEELAGSWEGEPLVRPAQLPLEVREELI